MEIKLQNSIDGAGAFNPAAFISIVTGVGGDDFIGIAMGSARNRCSTQAVRLHDDVLFGTRLLENNYWFCGSVLDGKGHKAVNCLWTKSIILDVDYGTAGHKRESSFPDMQSALDHIYSQRIQPQIVWHTGHGVQLAFLLDENISFSDTAKTRLYEKYKMGLNKIFRGDSTCSPEHLFRMPCSMNRKPDCLPIRGEMLRWEVMP